MTGDLPKFTDSGGNAKHVPLASLEGGAPSTAVRQFLEAAKDRIGKSEVRVLDLGCGRGDRVAWLLGAGWDAWGCDIAEDYLSYGRPYFELKGWGGDRLSVIPSSGSLPYEADFFDIVVSDQVVEHVADLDMFVRELARVTSSGGLGLHAYPAKHRVMEPHMHMPFVHWLPKGEIRRLGISVALRLGVSAPYFADYDHAARVEIFSKFSESETFYRRLPDVKAKFGASGFVVDSSSLPLSRIRSRLTALPERAANLAVFFYTTFEQVYLETRRV